MDGAMVPMVKAILILDGEGNRLAAKYYEKAEFPTDEEQVAFEQKLYRKTKHTNARNEGILARPPTMDHFRTVRARC